MRGNVLTRTAATVYNAWRPKSRFQWVILWFALGVIALAVHSMFT